LPAVRDAPAHLLFISSARVCDFLCRHDIRSQFADGKVPDMTDGCSLCFCWIPQIIAK